ncbi:response regulator [Granulosicoccus sp. 3-233]|uniref:hybrid sensor histidine kinase/response regulator n=1 Tax=Granulosicoccus sp. 3-233 TaxID=3417969 RepID=UPI003D337D1D
MLLNFAIHLLLFSCIPFYFARQKSSIRSISFFCYLSVLLVAANYGGSIYLFPITENITVSGGTLVYCAFMMTTVLFVIIERDIGVMRAIIRLVIGVNLLVVVLSMTISWTLRNPEILNPFNTSIDIFKVSLLVTSIGGMLVIAELVSLIYLFERIKARFSNVFAVSVLYIVAFITVICLDGVLFPLILNPFSGHFLSDVKSGVSGNFIMAFAYGTPMLLFLVLFRKRLAEYMSQPLLLRELVSAPRERLIDEIERQHKSLVLSEQKFRNLAESIDDIFFSVDKELRYTYWNKAAERSGYPSEEVLGKHVFDLFTRQAVAPLAEFYQSVLDRGKPDRVEIVLPILAGNRDFEVSAYPFDEGLSVLVKDITESKELQARLLQSQRMESIGRLAGSIAHDFNNLLVPITANAELGMMQHAARDKLHGYFKRIAEAAEQAAGLTRQILAFSRKQVLEMQVLDLNTVVTEYESMIKRLIGEGIKIHTALDADLAPVTADRGQIEQVLLNLVVNARDAMPAGGTLTIGTANITLEEPHTEQYGDLQPAGSYSMLVVRDTGHGMDSDTRQKIFEPFFTTKTQGKGTGLGLATVYGIVKQHNGNVIVHSEPGVGSTFKLYFQHAGRSARVPARTTSASNLELGTETILLVEDGTMVRNILREGLETYGYTVLEAEDVADALRLAAENDNIDLLLTDIAMPDMNGRELYDEVVRVHPSINVLFISGYTDDVIVEQGILEEGVNFLHKPFSIASLVQKVKRCLGQSATSPRVTG